MKFRDWFGGPGPRRVPSALVAVTIVFYAFAVTLFIQPARWASTPAYGILIDIFPQTVWGAAYVMLSVTIYKPTMRPLAVTAHTAAIALTSLWLVAFVIRYATDVSTTVVNVASWSTYLMLLIQSALVLDDSHGQPTETATATADTVTVQISDEAPGEAPPQ
jgi:hypothetical protein